MKFNYRGIAFVFLGIFFIIILTYNATSVNKISGRAVFNLEEDYQKGEPLDGILKISLKQGELIPASSKIVFENAGEKYEYNLEEVVLGEKIEGNFYLESKSISGEGFGYGFIGEKITYPDVYFSLEIYDKATLAEKGKQIEEEKPEEKIIEEESLEEQNETQETQIESNETEELQEVEEIGGEIIKEQSQEIEEEIVEENQEKLEKQSEIIEKKQETKEVKAEKEQKEEEKESKKTPITPIGGNVIRRLFGRISNFFLILTGRVITKLENGVQGKVSVDNPLIYNLKEGESVEILSGSVKTDSKELPDNTVKLSVKENKVTITTNYLEREEGFGKDYLGEEKSIIINLSQLALTPKEKELKISLVYNEEEIVYLITLLGEKEEEITIIENATKIGYFLSKEEKEILRREFGNSSIKRSAQVADDGILVKKELGDFWIENFYPLTLSDEELELQMQEDDIRWLKDIVRKISEVKKISLEKIEKLEGEINLF